MASMAGVRRSASLRRRSVWTRLLSAMAAGIGTCDLRSSIDPRGIPILRRGLSRSDRPQDHSTVRDKCHDEAQYAAQENGRNLAVLGVHPDEHEALDRQNRGGYHRERWLPTESGRDDQP